MLLCLRNLLILLIIGRLRIVTGVYRYIDISYSRKGSKSHDVYYFNLISGRTSNSSKFGVNYTSAVEASYKSFNQKTKHRLGFIKFLLSKEEFESLSKLCDGPIEVTQ